MNLQEIKTAIDSGKTVHWASHDYTVIKDDKGQYLIKSSFSGKDHYIGLTWEDGTTLNGKETDFFIPVIFNKQYDDIFYLAVELFGKRNVKADVKNNRIIIKSYVLIVLHLSFNETKMYIDTSMAPEGVDILEMNNLNPTFRLFDMNKVSDYLKLKKTECDFIETFAG